MVPRNWYITYDDEEKKYTEIRRDSLDRAGHGTAGRRPPRERRVTGLDASL